MGNKEKKFVLLENLEDCSDSMAFDSGTEIASLMEGSNGISLMVGGDVRVIYKDAVYKYPTNFPAELKELFRTGEAWNHDDVEIGHNNWFSWDYIIDNSCSEDDVCEIELEKYTPETLRIHMETILKYMYEKFEVVA